MPFMTVPAGGSGTMPGLFRNREELLSSGDRSSRALVLQIAEAAVAAARPDAALLRTIRYEPGQLTIAGRAFTVKPGERIFVIGAGKATFPIAHALEQVLGTAIHAGVVTCKEGQPGALRRIDLRFATHPLPTSASVAAASRTSSVLRDVRSGDIVIACFTGGSSALFASPIPGVSVTDKAATTQLLLTCGADIFEINSVRKHLSLVKGGRLARALPAGVRLINLTVSDVIGDRLDYITDPTVPDTSSFAAARETLDRYRLWERLPESVAEAIRRADPAHETVREADLRHLDRTDVILVAADAACRGAMQRASHLGLRPVLLSTAFDGDSAALARAFVAIGRQVLTDANPAAPPCVLIGGGETTVSTGGNAGLGGPNQEFAVRAALSLAGSRGIAALALDTDGTDGPTGLAGGIADGDTLDLARSMNVDLEDAIYRHDVSSALLKIGHAVVTGPTGTNVNDLKLLLVDR